MQQLQLTCPLVQKQLLVSDFQPSEVLFSGYPYVYFVRNVQISSWGPDVDCENVYPICSDGERSRCFSRHYCHTLEIHGIKGRWEFKSRIRPPYPQRVVKGD